jgi:hypothetical protein
MCGAVISADHADPLPSLRRRSTESVLEGSRGRGSVELIREDVAKESFNRGVTREEAL